MSLELGGTIWDKESKELDGVIENSLIENNIPFHKIKVDDDTVDNIIELINI